MEPSFKVNGKDVDAQSLQQEVSRRMEERRQSGIYSTEIESLLAERLPDEEKYLGSLPPLAELDYSATRARSSWEVTSAYPVDTEKTFLRPLVIFVKRLFRFWARVAVGPIQREQSTFNRHVAQALDALRRQAIANRAKDRAQEEDLSLLMESLIDQEESREIADACTKGLGEVNRLTVLGPCSEGLLRQLDENGFKLVCVSLGSTWEEPAQTQELTQGPLFYLEQLQEESIDALLIPELAFWLRPEALIGLTRRAYLILSPAGRLAVAVHGFATGSAAPAWCGSKVVTRALQIAGFKEVTVINLEPARDRRIGGYVTVARK